MIIADPGVFQIAKRICPEIERHISTPVSYTHLDVYKRQEQVSEIENVIFNNLPGEEGAPHIVSAVSYTHIDV